MVKKITILFLMICCVAAQGKMVNRYSFTDGDTVAIDSISGEDGILTETATISGNQLVLDGSSAVELPADVLDEDLESVTIEAWFQDDATGNNWSRLFDFGATDGGNGGNAIFCVPQQYGNIRFTVATNGLPSWQTGEDVVSAPAQPGEEIHVACVWDGPASEIKIYVNGELIESAGTEMDITAVARENSYIGDSSYPGDPYFTGNIDEFRIYNTALTDDEVLASFNAGPDVTLMSDMQARNESPQNGALYVLRDTNLSWTPGFFANKHNVYFGTDFNDVNDGIADVLVSEGQSASTYDPGRLIFGTTYYWRIDEVNSPPDRTVHKGLVWSFTVEPEGYQILPEDIIVTASSFERNALPENTINNSGIDVNNTDLHSNKTTDMWMSNSRTTGLVWIKYEFDKLYKLHEMLVWNYNSSPSSSKYGFRDVKIEYSENDLDWTELTNVPEFSQAPGTENYEYGTVVEFNNITAKYVTLTAISNWNDTGYTKCGLSEVRFLSIPVHARNPYPEMDSNDVPIDVTLSWRIGREAVSNKVYISTNLEEIEDNSAFAGNTNWPNYSPMSLDLSSAYYWRIDEVNNFETSSTWTGSIWSFRTQDYIIVDDFEDYNDTQPYTIWDTWSDGWDDTSNGSIMGYPDPDFDSGEHFVETDNIYGGNQAAPIIYNNSGSATYSEVSINPANLQVGTDWTAGSPETLVMWFLGDVNNSDALMYVKLNNSKVYYDGDLINLNQSVWRQWNIDLSEFGISLGNITKFAIGFERVGGNNVESMILVDDIRLYRIAPETPEPEEPGTEGLVAYYAMENNVQDSSGNGHHGTVMGAPIYVQSTDGYGKAMEFNADSNDCINLGDSEAFDPAGSFSISVWAYIKNWSTDWGDVLVSNRGEDGVGWQLRRPTNEKICFTTRGVGVDDMNSELDAPLFEWVHIACVYNNDENTKRIYLDGILDSEVDTDEGETIAPATQNVYIGARAYSENDGTDSYFTGIIDEVRLYDRALSDGEIVFLADPTPQ